jgi:rhodanese-related sulfurtransferase
VLVDCRTDAERAVSTLAGSISQTEFTAARSRARVCGNGNDEFWQHNHTVICFCTAGLRSGLFAQSLLSSSTEQNANTLPSQPLTASTQPLTSATPPARARILNFRGSLLAWTHAGGALVDGVNGKVCSATPCVAISSRTFARTQISR